ncbi:MAG: hypothetical protein ACP6IS_06975 [Candidatus Asgardarchaeia archaeon]
MTLNGIMLGDKLFKNSDSSSAVVRAVSSSLKQTLFDPFELNPKLRYLAEFFSLFGAKVRVWLANMTLKNMGTDRTLARYATIDIASKWVVSQYYLPNNQKYNFIVIGAPSGAAAHLASILGAPFLTQHFLLILNANERNPDDVNLFLKSGLEISNILNTINNPDLLEIIIHYDPAHDRFMLRYLDTIRFKLRKLPSDYRSFMINNLKDEATIVFLDVKYFWYHYRIGDNITFQIGGLGDISPDEYINGSERLSNWLKMQGSKASAWSLGNEYSIEKYPESEWGTVSDLENDVQEFANENGFKFIKLSVDHPEKVSEFVFNFYLSLFNELSIEPTRYFFDMFTAINPYFNIATSSIPIWLPFRCYDSFRFAEYIVRQINKEQLTPELFFLTLVPGYTETLDQVKINEWIKLLSEIPKKFELIGTSKKYYPFDIVYPFRYISDLKNALIKYTLPLNTNLGYSLLLDLVRKLIS